MVAKASKPRKRRRCWRSKRLPLLVRSRCRCAACCMSDHRIVPRQHNRLVLPMIDALLRRARCRTSDSRRDRVRSWPRIVHRACASPPELRRASALGLSVPVVPVSSLAAFAQTAVDAHREARGVLATIRSRADEIYSPDYGFDGARDVRLGRRTVVTAIRAVIAAVASTRRVG